MLSKKRENKANEEKKNRQQRIIEFFGARIQKKPAELLLDVNEL